MLNVSGGEKKVYQLPPAETVQAVCWGVFDLGMQAGEYKGVPNVLHKLVVCWELNETIPEGEYKDKRFNMSKQYTASIGEKATLRADLEAWRGRPFTPEELKNFDMHKLIGVNCFLGVIHKESKKHNVYAAVGSVTKLPKGMLPLKPEQGFDEHNPPEWIKKIQALAVQSSGVDHSEPVEQAEQVEGNNEEPIPF